MAPIRFHALEYSSTVQSLSARFIRSAGQAWVHKAQADLFSDPGNISIENLMVSAATHMLILTRMLNQSSFRQLF